MGDELETVAAEVAEEVDDAGVDEEAEVDAEPGDVDEPVVADEELAARDAELEVTEVRETAALAGVLLAPPELVLQPATRTVAARAAAIVPARDACFTKASSWMTSGRTP